MYIRKGELEPKRWAYEWFHYCVRAKSLGCLFATLRTVAREAPLSVEFSRQEYCSGLLFPTPGDLPHPETELASVTSALAGEFDFLAYDWFHDYLLIILLSLEKCTDVIISI